MKKIRKAAAKKGMTVEEFQNEGLLKEVREKEAAIAKEKEQE